MIKYINGVYVIHYILISSERLARHTCVTPIANVLMGDNRSIHPDDPGHARKYIGEIDR